ncbi:hypothetical protein [Halocynthiibacter namhaensis]|uniref:hypothetical protein n=1 Tax=Halocynthiibacter namhaensis TaxID=1290553 RepID=UPI0005798F3F|nr:hypothetical protein [Halocynthiibacter namhaensis]
MKNYVIGGLLCLLGLALTGFTPLQRFINEMMRQGTLVGMSACVNYSDNDLLSQDAIRTGCAGRFQKPLFHSDYATGRAGPRVEGSIVSWGGTLRNKQSDHVTTWLRLSVSIYDAEGDEQEVFVDTPIWIEPLGEADFMVELPEVERDQIDDITFCKHEDTDPKACLTWGVVEIMGLSI